MNPHECITDTSFALVDGLKASNLDNFEVHAVTVGMIVHNKKTGKDQTLLIIRDGEGKQVPLFAQQGLMDTLNDMVKYG